MLTSQIAQSTRVDLLKERIVKRLCFLVCMVVISLSPVAAKEKIQSTEQLIRAMHDRYADSWYKTLTFVQKNTRTLPDGSTETSIWYEAMSAPGKLRVDFEPVNNGDGILFVNDTQLEFKKGKLARSRERIHPLMVLGFDVYRQPVEVSVTKLNKLRFDLSVLREDIWQGRPAYVVGARQGDDRSPQFWIDKENLYFVRMIEPGGKDGTSIQETQFNKYLRVKEGGWVAPEVVFIVDGKRVFLEEYSDIRTNVKLDEKLFDPQNWTAVNWR
jgi:outer membrane lipoprotein-sorting protein